LVRLLGPIEVDGVRLREKAVAVLAYLAVHRTASGDTLEDACWTSPSNGRSRKRLKDVVSECRSTVGIEHLPHAIAGTYTVGPNVTTDLDLFERALERAVLDTGLERAGHLQNALDLIRGRIFAFPSRSTPSFGWVDLENLVSHWELRIEDVARECALLLSDAGQVRDSVVVLLRALEVLPLNVGLTEALMTVHAAAGEHHAVEAVFRAHAEGLARIHDCEPEGTTVDLRAELLAPTRRR
jgi:DNA-binding SARP family transcriptional activator